MWSVVSVVCRSVGQSVTLLSPTKTAEPIEMPFGLRTWVGPRNHVLDWGPDPPGHFEGEAAAHCKVQGYSAVTCVKMAELIVMLFGLWARTGPRNRELDGVQIPHEKGQFWEKGHPLSNIQTFCRALI